MLDEALSTAKLIAYSFLAVVVLGVLAVAGFYIKPIADIARAFLSRFADFAKTPRGQIIILVGCVALGLYFGARHMRQVGYDAAVAEYETRLTEEREKRHAQVTHFVIAADAAGQRADQAARERDQARAAKTAAIIREVPRYVTPAADARCLVPRGFVWLHDAGRAGLPASAGPTGDAVDEATTVTLSDLARDEARTVELYDACRAQVTGLQDWYRDLRTEYAKLQGAE